MAQIDVTPLYMKDVTFTVGTDSYEKAISSVTLTPTYSTATFKGLDSAATYSASGAATWMCDITFVQDWDTTGSLAKYLFANQGTEVTATFTPQSGGDVWTVDVILQAGAIGGGVDTFATSTVSMPVQGQPTFV